VGDTIDYVQLKEGLTLGAVITSIKTFCGKLGSAAASYSVLAMLALTGYVENVVGEGQSAAAVAGINLFRFGVPALCCVIVLLMAIFYPIRKHYGEIREMKAQIGAAE